MKIDSISKKGARDALRILRSALSDARKTHGDESGATQTELAEMAWIIAVSRLSAWAQRSEEEAKDLMPPHWPNATAGEKALSPAPTPIGHIGMDGKRCRCTRTLRAAAVRGCPKRCHCCDLPHRKCRNAEPCIGKCGRMTTASETTACGYCVHCAADARWVAISGGAY